VDESRRKEGRRAEEVNRDNWQKDEEGTVRAREHSSHACSRDIPCTLAHRMCESPVHTDE